MSLKILVPFIILSVVIFSGCTQIESVTEKIPVKISKDTSKNVTSNVSRDTTPPSGVSHLMTKAGHNWINWSWENPQDQDFRNVMVYIDGKYKANITAPKNFYNMTGLAANKQYRIGLVAVDRSGNMNPEWVNVSTSTGSKPVDKIPPDTIWYLEVTGIGPTYLNWTWENPADTDYAYANVYIDDKFKSNVSKPKAFYNLTKLNPGETHTIAVRTVDKNKNINPQWVTDMATTIE